MKKDIQDRLVAIRALMKQKNVQALIVPSSDPHMSEYLPKRWQGRAWLSGFTGSAGTLVVGESFAYLWTDSRYWIQAENELAGTGIDLKKLDKDAKLSQTLIDELKTSDTVCVDGAVMPFLEYNELATTLSAHNIKLISKDLMNEIWHNRPELPTAAIYAHNGAFVGDDTKTKLAHVREQMRGQATVHLLSGLDDIAWLTNLRGADVECNPVFLAHMLIWQDRATLYVDDKKLTDTLIASLQQSGIDVQPYERVFADIQSLQGSLLIDPNKVAYDMVGQVDEERLICQTNPTTLLKAIKTDTEISHIKEAMVQDGAALCAFFADIENRIAQGERVTELLVDELLTHHRSQQPNYVGASFETIAGFCGNGAIVHYRATHDSHSVISGNGLLLIDSGGQYENGTTDITRMLGVGSVCSEAKRDVTLVLKAHIALACAVFPKNLSSVLLDIVCRMPMWQAGLDYGHGTGHGVGYFLNVHEGPQSITYYAPQTPNRVMKEGMITSNEPGLYRTGKWGIRLENLVVCVPHIKTEFGEFSRFETLTLCPFDSRILLPELLDETEKAWLNAYHKMVYEALAPHVSGDAKTWLTERTALIE